MACRHASSCCMTPACLFQSLALRVGRRPTWWRWLIGVCAEYARFLPASFDLCYWVLQAADVVAITTLFFGLVLLAATQDIAVDGWALTLLSRRHVG
jgi:MFS transporter, PAT family, solute carrier family 33 (acetyl-CoA transportor), member 1